MRPRVPRLLGMTRIVLGIVLLTLLSGCSTGVPDDGEGGARDAEQFKADMDALARAVLPDLQRAVGGELPGMEARFYEKGGSLGIWQYEASGQFQAVPTAPAKAIAAARRALEEHGLQVESRGDTRLQATAGNVYVSLDAATVAATSEVLVDVDMGAVDGLTSRDDYAESAPPEDYSTYAK